MALSNKGLEGLRAQVDPSRERLPGAHDRALAAERLLAAAAVDRDRGSRAIGAQHGNGAHLPLGRLVPGEVPLASGRELVHERATSADVVRDPPLDDL